MCTTRNYTLFTIQTEDRLMGSGVGVAGSTTISFLFTLSMMSPITFVSSANFVMWFEL